MAEKKKFHLIFILVLITANLALFLPSMKGDFIWDDKYFVSQNPHILSPNFLETFLTSPFGGSYGTDENSLLLSRVIKFFRPFTSLSYWIDYKIWGLNPAAFHLTNIIIQIANVLLLYFILVHVLGQTIAFGGSLLFSVFPPHFENVSWISGRTDLLAFLFAALSVLCFLKFWKRQKSFLLLLSAFFYLSSLLAKETAVFLPAIYFLLLLEKDRKTWRNSAISIIPFVLVFLVYAALRIMALGTLSVESSGRTLLDFISTVGFYVARSLIPFNLSMTVDSYLVFKNVFWTMAGVFVALTFLLSAVYLLEGREKYRNLALFFFSYFLLLMPSALVIFSASSVSLIAWRFLYLPSAVFLSGAVLIILKKGKPRVLSYILFVFLSLLYAAEAYPKNRLYGNNEKDFWLSFKNINREDIIARFNIGIMNLGQDEKKALAIFEDIIRQREHPLQKHWEIRIYEELAEYDTFKKKFEQAEQYFNKLFGVRQVQSQHFYFNYAYFLAMKGNVPEGERFVLDMLKTFPENHLVLTHAAKFYMIVKDYEKTISYLKKDYELFPTQETLRLIKEVEALRN